MLVTRGSCSPLRSPPGAARCLPLLCPSRAASHRRAPRTPSGSVSHLCHHTETHPRAEGAGEGLHQAGLHYAGGSCAMTAPRIIVRHPQAEPQQLSHNNCERLQRHSPLVLRGGGQGRASAYRHCHPRAPSLVVLVGMRAPVPTAWGALSLHPPGTSAASLGSSSASGCARGLAPEAPLTTLPAGTGGYGDRQTAQWYRTKATPPALFLRHSFFAEDAPT